VTAGAPGAVPRPAYDLLPVIYRMRDAEQALPLSALLAVVEDELRRLRQDVDSLYDDWFIETCAEWVVSYIGDLLGVQGLRAVPGGAVSQRALVANTIRYRRGKGTPAVLERVARDVTGWPARVVEYFRLLGTTQHLDHVRLTRSRTADLRDADGLVLVGTAFDETARSADVRHIDILRGRYNLPDIGLYLWRLAAYRVEGADARAADDQHGRWTFDPAGRDVPLFHPGRPGPAGAARLTQEHEVPAPLGRRALLRDLAAADPIYLAEPDPAFRVTVDGEVIPVSRLRCCDLADWHRPAADPDGVVVAVDPVLGRLTVADGSRPGRIQVDYAYGFAGDVGAGPFDRRPALTMALGAAGVAASAEADWVTGVSRDGPLAPGRIVGTIGEALLLWNARTNLAPGQLGVIALLDSATYDEDLDVVIPPGDTLLLVAASLPAEDQSPPAGLDEVRLAARGLRPHLAGDIRITGPTGGGGQFLLDGLSIEGRVIVGPGDLASLVVSDATVLSPGGDKARPDGGQITASGNPHLAVHLLRTICAGLNLTGVPGLTLADSLLYDGGPSGAGPPGVTLNAADARTQIDSCTVIGGIVVRTLTASNSILDGRVDVSHRQEGCIRFSYLPPDSRTPRRYRCQPSDDATAGSAVPRFTSLVPADPGFGQLARDCPPEVAAGADDEGEMGAFHLLQQSLRIANLDSQLDQYLRFGLEAGIFFAT
jgi:hypothetical protein